MKTTIIHRARGFTLIELLVVIFIIAVLASLGFTAGNAAIQRARKTSALNTATAIEQAVNNFFNEYGYLPSSGSADLVIKTDDPALGKGLILVLSGQEPVAATMLNTKNINFLTVKEGKESGTRGKDGMIYDASGVPLAIYDPWGGPYMVALDLGYDEKINFNTLSPKPKAHSTRTLNSRKVAVWSDGADWENPASTGADDVVTW